MNIWQCPKCRWNTEQPDAVNRVGHLCRGGKQVDLRKLDAPKVNIRAAIVAESLARFPNEACGFILTTGTAVAAANVAADPATSFVIDSATAETWWPTGKVAGVWHSHCYDPAMPSDDDERLAHPDVECWIYSVMDEELGIYKPTTKGGLKLVAMEDLS